MSDSASASLRRKKPEGALVVSNRVSPGVPESVIDILLDEGLVAQADFDTGRSLNVDEIDSDNSVGRGSLNTLTDFSKVGGYVLAHKDGLDRVVVGRAGPGSLRFEELEGGEYDGKVLKCVQLDVYAEIHADRFDGIQQIANTPGRNRHTFTELNDESEAERVVSAVTVLEREGRLNRSPW